MMTPTLHCLTCESEIDVAKDPRAVKYWPNGSTDVLCAECIERAYQRWKERTLDDWPDSISDQLCEAYRIKRGWRA